MKKGTQTDFIRTALRLPPDLHARIHAAASKESRTFNGEIVERLQASFEDPEPRLPALHDEVARRLSDSALAELRGAMMAAIRESRERLAAFEAEVTSRARQEVQRSLAGGSEGIEPKPSKKRPK